MEHQPVINSTVVDYGPALASVRAEKLKRNAGGRLAAPTTPDTWPPDYEAIQAWRQMKLAQFDADPELLKSAWVYYKHNAAEFIMHWCDTYDPRNTLMKKPVWMPLVLYKRQVEMVQFVLACMNAEQSGAIEKSRDMGATWTAVALSVWLWVFWPGSASGWGSRTQIQVDRLGDPGSIFEKIRMQINALPDVFKPAGLTEHEHLSFMRCLNPINGASITGEIGNNIGRGGRTLIYFVDEAAHLEQPEKVEASLSENTRVRIDISSVSGLGTVFHRKREAGVDWEPGQEIVSNVTNVFVMDWRHHPTKTEEWFNARKKKFEQDGLKHVFARETERDYAAATEGVIIEQEWVQAALDAHLTLRLLDAEDGPWVAAVDVADGGIDRNAITLRKGIVAKHVNEWGDRDTGVTARKVVDVCSDLGPMELQYDSIGVGAGIKAETNRLRDEGALPEGLRLVPWNAGVAALFPHQRIIPGDEDSPKNKDFYGNLKAQAWWQVARMFEHTYRAINEPDYTWKTKDLISISSEMPAAMLRQLMKELSQATRGLDTRLRRVIVNKTPPGTRSPNLADSFIMCYWPFVQPRRPGLAMGAPKIIGG